MRIFVDADACPVVKIVEKIAKRYGIDVILLCDTNHILTSCIKQALDACLHDLPEILPEDHIFYRMPNVLLTPHIAGSLNDEVHRMAQYMIEEYTRVMAGEAPLYEVSWKMLETMA